MKHTIVFGSLVLSFLLSIGVAPCVEPDHRCLEHVTRWSMGTSHALALYGDFLVFGRGASLEVAAVGDDGSIEVIGRVMLPDQVMGIAIKGHHAFVANRDAGFRVVDLSSPSKPREVAFVAEALPAVDVAVSGGLVLVACAGNGAWAFNVDTPSDPFLVYSDRDLRIIRVAANDTTFFALESSSDDLLVFVRSFPNALFVATRLALPRTVTDITAAGSYVYSVSSRSYQEGGMRVIDVSTPTAPVIVGELKVGGIQSEIVVDGNLAFILESNTPPHGVRAVDVSDPTKPVDLSFYQTDVPDRGLAVKDEMLFVSASGRLDTFDITDPSALRQTATHPLGLMAVDVEARDRTLYVADSTVGVWILDVSRPRQPRELAFVDVEYPGAIDVDGTTLFVAARTGVHVFDVSVHTEPVKIGFAPSPRQATDIVVGSGIALVTATGEAWGVGVFDVSDPSNPTELCHLGTGMYTYRVVVENGIAHVLTYPEGLHLINITDPSDPTVVGLWSPALPDVAQYVAVAHGIATASGPSGPNVVHVVDVRDPSSPFEVGTVDWVDRTDSVAMFADVLYLVSSHDSIRVIDLAYPWAPYETQRIDLDSSTGRITSSESWVFVPVFNTGLEIFHHCPAPDGGPEAPPEEPVSHAW